MRKLLILSLLPISALAVEDKEVSYCAAVNNAVERLECYDSIAAKHSLAPILEAKAIEGIGSWEVTTKVDPLNDKNVYLAGLSAATGSGRYGDKVVMLIRCAENKTDLIINWNSYLGREAEIIFRIDKQKAQKSTWQLSTDKKAAFYPGSPVKLLKQLAESTSFVANVTPYNENPITAIFDTSGADSALKDVRKECGW
ncbi:type VI secretion system-associated protein TagO [Pseudomonas sp. LTJR-52]|uniref:type VI secretion system-associated protein TagO n=1 Tax=Pseudomonas sp. LTJR-52 TaxID=2479392 RepID=UPI0013CF2888|nr:type VI secretion system-associated protein TagO [Pseudomonas sp. LTJR-52]